MPALIPALLMEPISVLPAALEQLLQVVLQLKVDVPPALERALLLHWLLHLYLAPQSVEEPELEPVRSTEMVLELQEEKRCPPPALHVPSQRQNTSQSLPEKLQPRNPQHDVFPDRSPPEGWSEASLCSWPTLQSGGFFLCVQHQPLLICSHVPTPGFLTLGLCLSGLQVPQRGQEKLDTVLQVRARHTEQHHWLM